MNHEKKVLFCVIKLILQLYFRRIILVKNLLERNLNELINISIALFNNKARFNASSIKN